MTTLDGTEAVSVLQGALRGGYIDRGAPEYDDARALYNAMIDKRPEAIVQCADTADVIAALAYARERDLRVAIRGGGHNGGGLGSVDDGLVIDLSPMRGVIVDPEAKIARMQGGAEFGAVDHATHAFGLAVPGGIISTTGVGGLTLGGGLGHITRKCGLTIDNLLSAEVVLADGSCVTADADRHPDLFWALRGGGGNFGIVTSFEFRCHEIGNVLAGPMLYDLEDSAELLSWWREFEPAQPDELSGFFAFLSVPPGPPFPEELHLRKVCAVLWCYCGTDPDPDACARRARSASRSSTGRADAAARAAVGVRRRLPEGRPVVLARRLRQGDPGRGGRDPREHGAAMPTWKSTMHLYPIDGAASRVGPDETPWAYRDANCAQVIVGVDPDPANAGAIRDWCVDYWNATHPYSMGGAYVNFMMDEGQDRVRATYGDNYTRLTQVKRAYDPDNFFCVNQNIQPD